MQWTTLGTSAQGDRPVCQSLASMPSEVSKWTRLLLSSSSSSDREVWGICIGVCARTGSMSAAGGV